MGEAQGRGRGTDDALWNRLQLWLHGKRWMFFKARKGGESRVEVGSVEGTMAKIGHFF